MSPARCVPHPSARGFVRAIAFFVGAEIPPWTGPVERRDPDAVRQTSVHLTWRCQNPHCRSFTMRGAYRVGRCNFCHTPRSTTP